jgi:LPXTG-motif cell wall-anchored protein
VIKRLLVLATAIVLATAAPAQAQYAPLTITVSSSAIAGGTIKITVGSFAPGTNVTVRVLPSGIVEFSATAPENQPLATTTTNGTTTTTKKPKPPKKSDEDDLSTMAAGNAKVLGKVLTDANGNGTAELPLPADVNPGDVVVAAEGASSDGSIRAVSSETKVLPLTAAAAAPAASQAAASPTPIAAPGAAAAPAAVAADTATGAAALPASVGQLPVTGSSTSVPLGAAGAACVATGGLVLIASRKRRRSDLA